MELKAKWEALDKLRLVGWVLLVVNGFFFGANMALALTGHPTSFIFAGISAWGVWCSFRILDNVNKLL
jgi:hypothetical protein